MVKSLALGLSQIKAASEPPSWLDHLCDQTLTVRSSQLPYPWSARNTYCRNLDRNAVFSSTLGTLLGSERKPDSILPTHTFPSCSRLGKSCLSPPTLQKKKKNPYYLFSHKEAVLSAGGSRQRLARVFLGTGRRRRSVVRC